MYTSVSVLLVTGYKISFLKMDIKRISTAVFLKSIDEDLLKYLDILCTKGFTSTQSLCHLVESDIPGKCPHVIVLCFFKNFFTWAKL